MQKHIFFGLLSITFFVASCNKDEGTGGEASIRGNVRLKEFDHNFTILQRDTIAFEEDVYIQYGDKVGVGDKVVTDLNGNFQFEYLRPGNYTIYIYSEDSIKKLNTKTPQSYTVKVKGNETVKVPEFVKYKTLDVDKGTGTIAGRIWLINYKANYAEIKDTALAQERDVYLIYGDHQFFDLRTRTNFNGRYEFQYLINGNYTFYVYTEDKTGATQLIPVKIPNLVVSDTSKYITNHDIYIEVK